MNPPSRLLARWAVRAAVGITVVVRLLATATVLLNFRGEDPVDPAPAATTVAPDAQQVERGRYLALVGNCAGCHTAAGAAAYAGGRALPTPFGTVYTSNLTPDEATGIGGWSAAHFWRALHNGRSKDGRLLSPVFPYASYTHVTRADSDALYAYLRSLPPVAQANRPHALRFPYSTQAALGVWRALFFRPDAAPGRAEPEQAAEWNRGAYLARGLAHCIECHSSRNALGAIGGSLELAGGTIPAQGWYAPSLASPEEAGLSGWDRKHIVQLLKTGQAPGASTLGPMAEVVAGSTQHWHDEDLQALALFLQELPPASAAAPHKAVVANTSAGMERGGKLYDQHCAACHGAEGQGAAGAYPPLAGNRAVTMQTTVNLVRIVRGGGFPPATAGNPRPYGMPPFGHLLDDQDIAAVLTYVRRSWGNTAAPVSPLDVLQGQRGD